VLGRRGVVEGAVVIVAPAARASLVLWAREFFAALRTRSPADVWGAEGGGAVPKGGLTLLQ
jgi:hypothetical protein